MNNNYIEVTIVANEDLQEILIATLSENNFEGFVQNENELLAYCPENLFDQSFTEHFLQNFQIERSNWKYQLQVNKNWNEEWEKNFEPVIIADKIYVRALFHPVMENIETTITIQPKMSFGTGHHSTTKLVLTEMLELDLKDKSILDMGCGTAVLAIYGTMKGAKDILAIDNDQWAYENAIENCAINNCQQIEVVLGDEKSINASEKFDVILSNITKNFNLANLPLYASLIKSDGEILLSGFYEIDSEDFLALGNQYGLKLINQTVEKNWTMLHFKK